MNVLIDSSAWVDYFHDKGQADVVDALIDENRIVTNQIILAELVPSLQVRSQKRLVGLLRELPQQPLAVDWDELVRMQIALLQHGVNGVGIPDLMIAQNAMQGALILLTQDRHFARLAEHFPLSLF